MVRHRSRVVRALAYDDVLWPFVYAPLLFILVLHVGVRIAWAFGYK